MASKLELLLTNHGPNRSSFFVDKMVQTGMSKEAARKSISRSKGAISRLSYIRLPSNESFIYLATQFGSPNYWGALLSALTESGSIYGSAVNGIIARGGFIPEACFHIISGAPMAQKKHLSSNLIKDRLINANLIKRKSSDEFGDCLRVHPHFIHPTPHDMKARLITEDITLCAVKDWLRNMNMAGYNSITTRDCFDNKRPNFGTVNWDLVGPSYLLPLKSYDKAGKLRQGFIVCEVFAQELN